MFLSNCRIITPSLLISIVLTISGCSSLPSKLLGKPTPTSIEVLILTTDIVNPDLDQRPSPIRLDFFQLMKYNAFNDSKYAQLIEKDSGLGEDLLEVSETIVHPDDLKSLTLELMPETKYLGMTAGFQNINNSSWRKLYIKQKNKYFFIDDNYLNLKIDNGKISLLSKKEMKVELLEYHHKHPEDAQVSKHGKFIKKDELDLSKGIFREQTSENGADEVNSEDDDVEYNPESNLTDITPESNLM